MKLLRLTPKNPVAVYGVLMQGQIPFAVTLERPWLDNKKGESCIPAGRYTCKRVNSPTFGPTFEVTNVPSRSGILFHKGNLEDDSRGCILVGESFNPVLGRPGITASKEGMTEFLNILQHVNEFTLEIEEWHSPS